MIEKIKHLELRDVWRHEAWDFTRWLEENIDVLNDVLDFNLTAVEREQAAGSFNIDLVAEDDSGNLVVIENQLEKSNHDHLGKVITYLTALDAKAAIWIVSDPRPEHIKAISWLNESSSASFYLLKVEAIKIGDSDPAPLLTLIVGPSEEAVIVGKTKKEMKERHILRHKFWSQLLEKAKQKTKLHSNRSPGKDSWISAGAGKSGLGFNYAVRQHDAQIELYINRDRETGEGNKEIFNQLYEKKEQIERDFGASLEWEKLEQKKACRIRKRIEGGGYKDEDKWDDIHEQMINTMIKFEKAVKSHIKNLKI